MSAMPMPDPGMMPPVTGAPSPARPTATVVKATYAHETRRHVLTYPGSQFASRVSYTDVRAAVHGMFRASLPAGTNPSDLVLKYLDDDGDWVVLESEADVAHALDLASTLRLRVTVRGNETDLSRGAAVALHDALTGVRASLDAVIAAVARARDRGAPLAADELTALLDATQLHRPTPALPARPTATEPAATAKPLAAAAPSPAPAPTIPQQSTGPTYPPQPQQPYPPMPGQQQPPQGPPQPYPYQPYGSVSSAYPPPPGAGPTGYPPQAPVRPTSTGPAPYPGAAPSAYGSMPHGQQGQQAQGYPPSYPPQQQPPQQPYGSSGYKY
ncbi:hypothetical protein AMAG_19555 [Allomyces macrogynus ATCC 38327]|uniref:PB1 domain-containing protein n=1 Tax=Allomyces macrogynus (strain ATCC 38327) TaxID=578462 RepID=A0A0L0SX60_ALLM3|nr:hypothetical protein AMAG_19555 [Allomyces macrogynus ATCC 38327]|eukprot:KNE66975.1 hypothetical protein AMAG_19555 [Allomyces macrogynus ATCC 38327]